MKKHRVYAFIGKIPYGEIGIFDSRRDAKRLSLYAKKYGIKNASGEIVSVNTKIVVRS